MISYPDYLRLLPKAELHCHFTATIRASTLIELAAKYDVELPSNDPQALFDYDNIVDFLAVLNAARQVFLDPAVFARVAYEGVQDAVVAGNLRYREYFLNAMEFPGFSYSEVVDAAIGGLRAAERDFGVGFGLIAAIDRSKSPASAVALVQQMIIEPRPEVIGLGQDDLTPDATESPELWVQAYRLAAAHGINRTAHVGEIPGSTAAAISVAVGQLGCARIDHGYHVLDDPAVVAMDKQSQIPFTCTPSSSRVLSGWSIGAEHPVAEMIRAGLNVTLNTDDPTFFRTDIGREYAETLPAMGFGPAVARTVAMAAVHACWAPPAYKGRLIAEFGAQISALDALLDPDINGL